MWQTQWEEVLRELEHAEKYCLTEAFPGADRYKQKVLGELGAVDRRLGRFPAALQRLTRALTITDTDELQRLEIVGELAVVYQHIGDYASAKESCLKQYTKAKELAVLEWAKFASTSEFVGRAKHRRRAFQAEAEACRAIGNLGRTNHRLSQDHNDGYLLKEAVSQLKERVQRAQKLQKDLQMEQTSSTLMELITTARCWESIGHNRLALVYAANGNPGEAVKYGELSQHVTQGLDDPTMRALSRFFYAYALLHNNEVEQARELFSFTSARDMCTCAIALCKEPSAEFCQYLRVITDLDVSLDNYDEQGYSALDYAVYNGSREMKDIILGSLARHHGPKNFKLFKHEAKLKRHYREVFQGYLRPILLHGGFDSFQAMRRGYADLLHVDKAKRGSFDELRMVRYSDFVKHGRLPSFRDGITRTFSDVRADEDDRTSKDFVIFFSYRWQKKQRNSTTINPDDLEHTQYRRMCQALEEFLSLELPQGNVSKENLYIWLDLACIDQSNKDPGVNALPIIAAQCNAMISLVEDGFFERGWCNVEAALVQALMRSYDRVVGVLKSIDREIEHDTSKLKVTFESDRPKIEFLLRQSRLLGHVA
ncbi:hypothetical protein TruAng_011641 [Truncatella angustata]|nr:hypothetical protein TruAng_011641 [Truncatella angustata]